MKPCIAMLLASICVVARTAQAADTNASVRYAADLQAPATPLGPLHTSDGDVAAIDVVRVHVDSDGTRLVVSAVLGNNPGEFATSVLAIYLDTDDNAATGATIASGMASGFDYVSELGVCAKYADGSSACTGGSKRSRATEHFSALDLCRFSGSDEMRRQATIDMMGFPGEKPAVRSPIIDATARGSIDYSDLKIKPGQTIRLLLRKTGGSAAFRNAEFFAPVRIILR